MEEWKDIDGFDGLYQISDLGRVRNVKTNRIRKPGVLPYGYRQVQLCKNGQPKNLFVHRLVAEAFVPNPDGKPQVNHLDENPANNAASNLEWCTNQENVVYSQARPVEQYDKAGKLLATFQSSHEAERQTGVGHIRECCGGRLKSAGGFFWRYAV